MRKVLIANRGEIAVRIARACRANAVTSYPQVLASAEEAGLLGAADVRELGRFYADPRRHRWHCDRSG